MKELFYNNLFDLPFPFRLIDLVDVLLVAFLLYKLYKILKGTIAFRILIGLAAVVILWTLVHQLDLRFSSQILGYFISVGAIAVLIVFQQEVRRFLILLGKTYKISENRILQKLLPKAWNAVKEEEQEEAEMIVAACKKLAKTSTGAIIVVGNVSEMQLTALRGYRLDALVSKILIENIFEKHSLLHDGAIIITRGRIVAAGCVLPVSDNQTLPVRFGLRHRAALGISEQTLAVSIIISEETGKISLAKSGEIKVDISDAELTAEIALNLARRTF